MRLLTIKLALSILLTVGLLGLLPFDAEAGSPAVCARVVNNLGTPMPNVYVRWDDSGDAGNPRKTWYVATNGNGQACFWGDLVSWDGHDEDWRTEISNQWVDPSDATKGSYECHQDSNCRPPAERGLTSRRASIASDGSFTNHASGFSCAQSPHIFSAVIPRGVTGTSSQVSLRLGETSGSNTYSNGRPTFDLPTDIVITLPEPTLTTAPRPPTPTPTTASRPPTPTLTLTPTRTPTPTPGVCNLPSRLLCGKCGVPGTGYTWPPPKDANNDWCALRQYLQTFLSGGYLTWTCTSVPAGSVKSESGCNTVALTPTPARRGVGGSLTSTPALPAPTATCAPGPCQAVLQCGQTGTGWNGCSTCTAVAPSCTPTPTPTSKPFLRTTGGDVHSNQ